MAMKKCDFYLRRFKKKKKLAFKGGGDLNFSGELNFTLSLLFFSASIIAPTCKANIINLEPCALNVDFQHFIPKSNKFPYFMDTLERRVWGERRPKNMVTLQIILVFTLTFPKTFTWGHVSVIKFGCVSVNDLHLHWIYTLYIWLLTFIRTTLVWTTPTYSIQF
jgi:hypothetical protein